MRIRVLKRLVAGSLMIVAIANFVGCRSNNTKEFNSNETTKSVAKGNNTMGFELFKELNKSSKGDNVVISPLSLSMIMSLLQGGAVDTTKNEIKEFLQLTNLSDSNINEVNKDILGYYNSLTNKTNALKIGNSIWINKGFDIEKEFIALGKDYYNATIKNLDFSDKNSVNSINNWVNKNTNGKIEKVVDGLDYNDKLLLINTLYMNSKWVKTFDKNKTQKGVFKKDDGQVDIVEYMINQNEFKYGKFDEYEMVQLPYDIEGINMNIILPNEGVNINDFVSGFDDEKLIKSIEVMENSQIDIRLPKFKVEYESVLNDSIKRLGVNDAFNENANFSKIADNIFVSEILQKTYIDVNETGTEAAAATKVEMTKTSMPQYTIFEVNRPFVFVIHDEKTDDILFIGKIETIKN